jgi:DeoR/GlpR family transcriptional regulator of sugar metabolism
MMGGSSVFAMARHIKDIPRLTVVTNSLPVSDYLHNEGRADQTVILAGGMRTPTDSLVGEIAIQTFDKVHVDMVFMGTHGMDVRGGYSSPNLFESETNLAIRSRAKKLIVLADHTKWGQVGFSTFAKLSDADVLITDSGLPSDALAELKQHVAEVQLVSSGIEHLSRGAL